MNILEKAVDQTDAEHGTKKFTILRQLNTMMYAHLTEKVSLRAICDGITLIKSFSNIQEPSVLRKYPV